MHRLIAASIVALALTTPANAETRALSGFTAIDAMNGVQVEIVQGDGYSVRVEGPDSDRVATRIHRESLRVTRVNENWFGDRGGVDAVVHVTMPRVISIAVARGAQVRASELRAGALSLSVSQGATLRVAGRCDTLSASASMGGQLEADGLDCETVTASASMGGNVEVHATQSLHASASMGGNIDVSGNPPSRRVSASMGGNVD